MAGSSVTDTIRYVAKRPETEKVKKIQIERDLVDKFESVSLDAFEQFRLQRHLKDLATFLSEDRVKHARSYMKSIFAEAVEQDFLLKDPTRGVKIPRNLRQKDKTTLTWHHLRAVLAGVPTRDRMLLTLEMTDALRPIELFALRWRSFDGRLTLAQRKGSVKDVQAHLRHSKADTTANEYMQELPESVGRTVESMYEELMYSQTAACRFATKCYRFFHTDSGRPPIVVGGLELV